MSAVVATASSTSAGPDRPPNAPSQHPRHNHDRPSRNPDSAPLLENTRSRTSRGSGQRRKPRDASQHSVSGPSAPASDISDRDKPARRTDGVPSKPPRRRQPREKSDASRVDASDYTESKGLLRDAPPHPHKKRAARFNPGLSEPSAAREKSATAKTATVRYAQPPSKDDDLTTILTRALCTSPYPDCPICFAPIHPAQPTWSCSPSSPARTGATVDGNAPRTENAQCCWTTFHLKCIRPWADKSVKDVEAAWRARGEDKKGDWRCPGCQMKRETVPQIYWCFCGSTQDPKPPRLSTPHSCANPCTRPRVCGHQCPIACHPGPCPPCMVTIQLPCFCGKQRVSFLCSRSHPGRSNIHPHGLIDLSCGAKCGRRLTCGNHFCQDVCHDGDCAACPVRDAARCWCGKEERYMACGQGEEKECVVMKDGVEERWTGKFACENTCDRPFDCGVHKCPQLCHPPSKTPPPCPRSPSVITHCPCGKHMLSDLSSIPFFPPSTKLFRETCSDPIPTCASPCAKPLNGCDHLCSVKCHAGDCPPCTVPIVRPCRCGLTIREVPCHQSHESASTDEILCEHPCRALRNCGKHQCNRPCCPLAAVANIMKSKGKKRAGPVAVQTPEDDAGWHQCDLVCGQLLECGNHTCEERDHKGPCPTCLRSSFEEMVCHCGRTVLEPPIPCGTRIHCPYPCSRPSPICGHPKMPHACHEDGTSCPPCAFLTAKPCACGKKIVPNKPCFSEKVSCGTPCEKLLACGFHRCEKLCHGEACAPCTAVCGKARKLCLPAQHPCTQPCHAPSACPETEPCTAAVFIACPCGRIRQSIQCGRCTVNPAGREATQQLKCTNECAVAKRNARLAEALGISLDARKGPEVVYSEYLLSFARANLKFLPIVEKAFADFVNSDKRVQVLPHMPETRRRFVNELAAVYRMDTQMVDQEPNRSVQLIRRIDTRIPSPLLSASLPASGPSVFGKLANLRATPSAWPRTQTPPTVANAVNTSGTGRGWTAVVAKASTQAPATPGPMSEPHFTPLRPSRQTAANPAPVPSSSASATPAAAIMPQVPVLASEDVPDDWEDDA
ncbi:hypothetical protein K488DRAFT_39490 [Vararia minispora EC-137]|uniref:Uncharacterized protein n=1 Tax=Vararia minispora EC-137 TaxID=1314806 RepID=A0ACB8QZK8_9AGAM|nr:hypothetical protein K488DRAFT_39490 [Vararia minispora EC-137]